VKKEKQNEEEFKKDSFFQTGKKGIKKVR